jgi:hypothetical protein
MKFIFLSMHIISNKLMHFIQNNHFNRNKNEYFDASLSKYGKHSWYELKFLIIKMYHTISHVIIDQSMIIQKSIKFYFFN